MVADVYVKLSKVVCLGIPKFVLWLFTSSCCSTYIIYCECNEHALQGPATVQLSPTSFWSTQGRTDPSEGDTYTNTEGAHLSNTFAEPSPWSLPSSALSTTMTSSGSSQCQPLRAAPITLTYPWFRPLQRTLRCPIKIKIHNVFS